ncbi:MAG: DNA-formamidopyrimidine glycosylase [Candidatus Krumholzibacteriales bacterium]
MPELPDVETFRRYLDATSLHRKIERAEVRDTGVLRKVSGRKFSSALRGRKFDSSERLGKYIFVKMDGEGCLMLHFGMTGFLKYYKNDGQEPPHTRILFRFSNGYNLAYDCQRKLGRVRLADDMESIAEEKKLGVDAMDPELDFSGFLEVLRDRRGMIKTALMNQSAVAGIGNIYADEILFQAGVHPEREAGSISDEKMKRIFRVMRRVLKTAIDRKADPDNLPRGYIIPGREEGRSCPRCGGTVKKIKVNGRGTYLCPQCQG